MKNSLPIASVDSEPAQGKSPTPAKPGAPPTDTKTDLERSIEAQIGRSLAGIKEELTKYTESQKGAATTEILKCSAGVQTRLQAKVEDLLRPIQRRTEELQQLAGKVGESYDGRRWRDRIIGAMLAIAVFVAGVGVGMVILR